MFYSCLVALGNWTQSDVQAFHQRRITTRTYRINCRKDCLMFTNLVIVVDLYPISCNTAGLRWVSPKSNNPITFSSLRFKIIGAVLVYWKNSWAKYSDLIIFYCIFKILLIGITLKAIWTQPFGGIHVICSPSAALQWVEWSVKWVRVSPIWHNGFRPTFKWYN